MDRGATPARAQMPGQTMVYETVVPGPPAVTYGERYKVRRRFGRTIIKERPVAYVTPTAPVVRETRVVQPAPIVESRVIQSAPVVERRVIQSAPIVQQQIVQPGPVIRTQYYGPYPY
jgi:hypothetical protein